MPRRPRDQDSDSESSLTSISDLERNISLDEEEEDTKEEHEERAPRQRKERERERWKANKNRRPVTTRQPHELPEKTTDPALKAKDNFDCIFFLFFWEKFGRLVGPVLLDYRVRGRQNGSETPTNGMICYLFIRNLGLLFVAPCPGLLGL